MIEVIQPDGVTLKLVYQGCVRRFKALPVGGVFDWVGSVYRKDSPTDATNLVTGATIQPPNDWVEPMEEAK